MAVAHIGHAELGVTDLEASRRFFTETIGLSVSQEDEDRIFLRAWQDWDHHTLILKRFERQSPETYFTYGTPIRPITAAPGAVSRYS